MSMCGGGTATGGCGPSGSQGGALQRARRAPLPEWEGHVHVCVWSWTTVSTRRGGLDGQHGVADRDPRGPLADELAPAAVERDLEEGLPRRPYGAARLLVPPRRVEAVLELGARGVAPPLLALRGSEGERARVEGVGVGVEGRGG